MKNLLLCRRTFIALAAIAALTGLGVALSLDTSMAIASVAIALAGSNAAESAYKSKFQKPV